MGREIANTNAYVWMVDEYEIEDYQIEEDEILVSLNFHCSGDQDPDRVFFGDDIDGHAEARIDQEGNVDFSEITAEIRDYGTNGTEQMESGHGNQLI